MKNITKIFGIIAMAIAISFTTVACGGGSSADGSVAGKSAKGLDGTICEFEKVANEYAEITEKGDAMAMAMKAMELNELMEELDEARDKGKLSAEQLERIDQIVAGNQSLSALKALMEMED